jgi:hypothetical protein
MQEVGSSDIWSAAACHSGDVGFELWYLPDMPAVLRALAGGHRDERQGWGIYEYYRQSAQSAEQHGKPQPTQNRLRPRLVVSYRLRKQGRDV